MPSTAEWDIEGGPGPKRQSISLGLLSDECQDVLLLKPKESLPKETVVRIIGTVSCHECGQPLPFALTYKWGDAFGYAHTEGDVNRPTCEACGINASVTFFDALGDNVNGGFLGVAPFTHHPDKTQKPMQLEVHSVTAK